MIGKSGKYTEGLSFEDCLQISIKDLGMDFRRGGHTLGEAIRLLETGEIKSVSGTFGWTKTDGWTGETKNIAKVLYSLRKDSDGVYLELSYSWKYRRETEYRNTKQRYYLIAKESNLKPGTYRYYFLDPYSEKEPGLCTKIYFYKGVFYPRSAIRDFGVLYRQQRQGHTQRYVWTFQSKIPRWEDMRRRKSHYRGKETPIWRRYNYLCEEGDRRLVEYLMRVVPGEEDIYLQFARSSRM